MRKTALLVSLSTFVLFTSTCAPSSNGPIWAPFVQELRDAGMASYKAAQSKNQDSILDAADKVTTACMKCHDKYREKTDAERCM